MTELTGAVILASTTLGIGACLSRSHPSLVLARASIWFRAVWLLGVEMALGAWERRDRWGECQRKAHRESALL